MLGRMVLPSRGFDRRQILRGGAVAGAGLVIGLSLERPAAAKVAAEEAQEDGEANESSVEEMKRKRPREA